MKTFTETLVLTAVAAACWATTATAQRGAGEAQGIARQANKPAVVEITGTVEEIKIGPCQRTTGRAAEGAHLLLSTGYGEQINLHLGPADAVKQVTEQVVVGDTITAQAFQTDKLGNDEYVAQSVAVGDETIALRNEALRPEWAGGRGMGRGSGQGRGRGQGRGNGQGRGGWGPGPGGGRCMQIPANAGYGPGSGRGYGRGQQNRYADEQAAAGARGYGRGYGAGAGYGGGRGRGRGGRW